MIAGIQPTLLEGYTGTAWAPLGGGATGGGSDAWVVETDQTVTTSYELGSASTNHGIAHASVELRSQCRLRSSSFSDYDPKKLNGTNFAAAPVYAGDDATGLRGTNELKLVTGGTARATVDSSGMLGLALRSTLSNNSTGIHIHGSGAVAHTYLTDSIGTANSDGTEIVAPGSDLYIDQKENAYHFFVNMKSADGINSATHCGTTSNLPQGAINVSGVATAEFYNAGGCYNTWSSGGTPTARGFVGVSNQLVSGGSGTNFCVRAQSS